MLLCQCDGNHLFILINTHTHTHILNTHTHTLSTHTHTHTLSTHTYLDLGLD
jgi:hypothetical protein